MKSYTVYLRQAKAPVLVREGFSVAAMIFGPFWLLAKGAWLSAILLWVLWAVVAAIHWSGAPIVAASLYWLQGLFGHDMRRCHLASRGYDLSFVVMGRDEQAAFTRLLEEYPGLRSRMAL